MIIIVFGNKLCELLQQLAVSLVEWDFVFKERKNAVVAVLVEQVDITGAGQSIVFRANPWRTFVDGIVAVLQKLDPLQSGHAAKTAQGVQSGILSAR